MIEKIKSLFADLYTQLVKMNDSPQRIALGFGVGVFLGILPGTGPIAALAMAFIFRLNKAAALLGGVLTNTWLSLATFVMAIKIGSGILGLSWVAVHVQARGLVEHFSWKALFDASGEILKPLLIGYAVIGLACGLLAYLIALFILKRSK